MVFKNGKYLPMDRLRTKMMFQNVKIEMPFPFIRMAMQI